MRKQTKFYTTGLAVVLFSTAIFSTGCGCFVAPPQPYGPRVVGDGTGSAIAVYEDIKGGNRHDFYVQKISPEGKTVWGDEGILVGGGYKKFDSYHDLHIVSDGSGGALVFWHVWPSDEQQESVSYITSVDSGGNVRWQKEVRWVDYMISDGAGGAIIATDSGYDQKTLFVIRIDSSGDFPWGEDGVSLYAEGYQANSLQLVDDGDAGAIIAWQQRTGEPNKRGTCIFTQRIDAEGNLSWGQNGVLLYASSEDVSAEELHLTGDSSGGAIATWIQVPQGKAEDGSPKPSLFDIYAQRVDSWGNTLWTDNGVPLETQEGGGSPYNYLVVSDASGTTILWGGYAGYIQKIDHDGNMKLQPGGVKVSDFSLGKAVNDDSGGVIVTFSHKEAGAEKSRLYVQRIDDIGKMVWQGIGTMVTERSTYDLISDEQGGAIVAWGIGKSTFSPEKSYVQRVSAEGNLLWGEKGIRLNP